MIGMTAETGMRRNKQLQVLVRKWLKPSTLESDSGETADKEVKSERMTRIEDLSKEHRARDY